MTLAKWLNAQIGEAKCRFKQADRLQFYIISRQQALQNNLGDASFIQLLLNRTARPSWILDEHQADRSDPFSELRLLR